MWTAIQAAKGGHPEFLEVSRELLESSSRKLVLATTIICGGLLLGFGLVRSGEVSLIVMPLGLLIGLVFATAYYLISRHLIAAQMAWLVGFCGIVTLSLVVFGRPEIAFLYALIPLMAVSMVGWHLALISGLWVVGLMAGINIWLGSELIPGSYIGMIAFGEILAGFIGWSAVSPLLTMLEWTNFSYLMARDNLEEARDQRLELKQVEEDLVLANKELIRLTTSLKVMTGRAEEARRVKEEFVANVSHELRTPLNMIIGYTNLIIKTPQAYGRRLPARLLADITSIQRNSQHLVELINDVLDLSQVDAGRMALTRQWSSAREIIEAAATAVKPLFESKGLYLKVDIPEDDLPVYCDNTRIREVILNLLSNAGRFTEQGGVLINAERKDEDLIVTVKDTGPGISSEDQQRVFEPFQQLDTMLHHRTGGSGLGLSISKRFVEMHEGKMWLESELGRGTCFSFRIPTGLPTEAVVRAAGGVRWVNPYTEHPFGVRERPFRAPRPELAPRFVIVEQEGGLERLFTRYMDSVEFSTAASLEEAVQEISINPAQALILNSTQPELALKASAIVPYNTPVISCWIPGQDEPAHRLGVVHYLLKPVDQAQLLTALDEVGKEEMSVLLVDDDLETLQLFARIISITRPATRVIRAASGREALQLMRERQPDIVLLDLVLPDIDGFEVLKVKAGEPQISSIPVIVVTSTDPSGIPIISNQFSVNRSNGMSVREFLDCLMAVSETLNPAPPKSHPGPSESAPA